MNTTASGQVVPELATSYSVSGNGLTYTFNLRHGVHFQDGSLLFDNILVRQALADALDRSSLANIAYVGAAVPSAYLPPSYSWATPLGSLPFSQYNPGQAKQLRTKAGYPNGVSVTLKYIDNYDPGTDSLTAQMQSELNAVGIHITLDPLQTAAWVGAQ